MAEEQAPQDILREHAFDGIHEYDNQLPRWWLWLFYLTIIWALWYYAHYHFGLIGKGKLGAEHLATVNQEWQEKLDKMDTGPLTEEELIAAHTDATRIANGEKLFKEKGCVSCHQPDAYGNIGPNMRDEYWMHGSQMSNMIEIITKGSPNGQMQPQSRQLSRRQMQDIVFYLVDLNKNTPKQEDGTTAQGKKPLTDRAQHPAVRDPFAF